ncbi:MAG: pyridoxal phosphate-dependent aminotransferase [Streptococcaceae bacterium]|jgi:cystathionine beta-lyase|nr:pyridoxal phosphate-dependent aminotransferase [Streptococcaceae bacterium]
MKSEEFVKSYAVERHGTASLKWDALGVRFGDPDLTAMWVADMEFKVPEVVQEALHERVDHGVFGYTMAPDSYYEAFINWQKKHHDTVVEKDWIRFSPGVVASFYNCVNAFTKEGDGVIIQSPVYYPMHNAAIDTHRKLVRSELKRIDGRYYMDLEDFEAKIVSESVKLFILCSPHNPAGRIWSEEELDQVLSICAKHDVLVVSDEIHQDILLGGRKFVSSLSVNNGAYHKNLIVLTAPSKTFNLACLLNSNVIIPDPELRAEYDLRMKAFNQVELSILGIVAAEAAYKGGEDWLEGLLDTIESNFNYLKTELTTKFPKVVVTELEATYLMWIDLTAYVKPEDTKDFIQNKCHLAIDFGEWFSDACKGFVRLNMATDPKYVKFAADQITRELAKLESE